MKTFTRSDVLSWRPCYGEIETLRIMEGLPADMTALDILRHEAATPEDRLWCVIRTCVLSERTLRMFAAWCARNVLDDERAAGREPDPRSWAAVETAERYALGQATDDELRDASAAAYDAAYAAAAYAAADCAATDADFAYAATGAYAYAATGAYAYAGAYAARAAARAVYAARAAAAAAAARASALVCHSRAGVLRAVAPGAAARAAQVARLVELIEENER